MKKFKNYILMLLVPLILLGCVSKGVSEAVEETDTLSGYTIEQLTYMSTGTNNTYSISKNISEDFYELLNNTDYSAKLSSAQQTSIKSLRSILYSIMSTISDSTINVSSSLSSVESSKSSLITTLSIFTESEIKLIEEQIENAMSTIDTSTLTAAQVTEITSTLPYLLNSFINKMSTVDSNNSSLSENYNIFYVPILDLVDLSWRITEDASILKTALGIDIYNLDISSTISERLTRISSEIARLNTSYVTNILTSSDVKVMNTAYTTLKTKYNAYTSGDAVSTISNAELSFRSSDLTVFNNTTGNKLSTYKTTLDTLTSKKGTFNASTSTIDSAIVTLLTEYDTLMSAYDNADFTNNNTYFENCISRSVNVAYIYGLLKGNSTYASRVLSVTGIQL